MNSPRASTCIARRSFGLQLIRTQLNSFVSQGEAPCQRMRRGRFAACRKPQTLSDESPTIYGVSGTAASREFNFVLLSSCNHDTTRAPVLYRPRRTF